MVEPFPRAHLPLVHWPEGVPSDLMSVYIECVANVMVIDDDIIHIQLYDDGSVVAYKDSHALHPSEIARKRPPWRVWHNPTKKWRQDQSIHIRCHGTVCSEWSVPFVVSLCVLYGVQMRRAPLSGRSSAWYWV